MYNYNHLNGYTKTFFNIYFNIRNKYSLLQSWGKNEKNQTDKGQCFVALSFEAVPYFGTCFFDGVPVQRTDI